jgi:putative Mg2+ transporter-C (MgtC) family protein
MTLATMADLPSIGDIVGAFRLDVLAKLAMAVVLGGAIGLEREIRGKPAGLRTNILICVGSALITDVSISIGWVNGMRGDPARLAAQIVSGVGFLGAGTILHSTGGITGLTSAATIWVVAALGIAVGAGNFVEAAGAMVLVALVLGGLGRFEHRLRRVRRRAHYTIRVQPGINFETLEPTLATLGLNVRSYKMFDHPEDRTFETWLEGPSIQFDFLSDRLLARKEVISIHGS